MDPYDFKKEFQKMADRKLNEKGAEITMNKGDLLNTVHKTLQSQSQMQKMWNVPTGNKTAANRH